MVSIKLKFRKSAARDCEGRLYFQVIYRRKIRQISTKYRIFATEWDEVKNEIILCTQYPTRYLQLKSIKEHIKTETDLFWSIYKDLAARYENFEIDDLVEAYIISKQGLTLFSFMRDVSRQLKEMGQHRTSETYRTALHSFMRFRNNNDVVLGAIDSEMMISYEAYLKRNNIKMNTISFYMRILRAVYNRAVEKGLIASRNPFRRVYTGVEKTIKRALPLRVIKQIKKLDLSNAPQLEFARDMFLFSFYTRGMSFVDMAFLRKSDLSHGVLVYQRRKTGQRLMIKWERCMASIVEKYSIEQSEYLLPIIRKTENERSQYKNNLHMVNRRLKVIAKMVGISNSLTTYVARHSWASIAKSQNIPISVISEGMGHDSEHTTQIYLASIDNAIVNDANRAILNLL